MRHLKKTDLALLRLSIALVCVALVTNTAAGADWPRFRGPGGLGVSEENGLPTKWSATENVAWKLELPGWGNSSPSVVGDRVYLTTQTDDKALHVIAIGKTDGRVVWSKQVASGMEKAHKFQNMATATPVADSEHVWALFGTGDLVCLSRSGEVLWKRKIQEEEGEFTIQWGMGTSPVLHEGNVYLACMQNGGASYVLAVDGATGDDVWKTERQLGAVGEAQDSYSTPILVDAGAGPQLVVCGADHIDGYDPASGTRLWVSSGLEVEHPYGRSIASPTFADGVFLAVASGFRGQGHLLALRAGGKGDVTGSHRMWTYDQNGPDCPTPVVYRGLVYMIKDNGVASCLDLETGELRWRERLFRGDVKVSPVAGDGKVYFTSGDAETKVVEAGPELKVIADNTLEETMLASPAISDGTIFFRTRTYLCAVRSSPAESEVPLPRAFVDGTGPGWRELGEDDFVNVNCAPDTWTWKPDGTLHSTGQPIGVIRSKTPYTNFELVAQWRHLRPGGNSGIFVWGSETSLNALKGPGLPEGIEVQVLDVGYAERYEKEHGKKADWFTCHGDVFPTGSARMTPFPPVSPNGKRSFPTKNLTKGTGEWNHYYVRCINGEVRLWVNGEEVSGGTGCEPRSGYLCLESEGSPVEFRRIRLRELP